MNKQDECKQITIFDTTLRDGEQSPGASLYPEEKVKIAHQLAKLGVDVIEPGFPASSPGDFQAVRQIAREVQGVEICGFARAIQTDIDAAVQATAEAERRRLHLFISSSQIHLDFQLKKSREQVLELARKMVAYAKNYVDQIEFSPMDATRTGEEFLFEMVEAVIAEGATIINIPDTVGYALPEEYGDIFRRVRKEVRHGEKVEYSAHCHNDLGLAVANSMAAIGAGATHVEVTVNGIGERSGNCSLEELAMAIETRKQRLGWATGINQSEIYTTSKMVSRLMNLPIAYNKPIVGRNAFQHEAGIHQDGLIKNRSTYEIMDPEQMGIPRNMIILGKHSGRHALKHRVSQYGIQLSEEELEALFTRFKETADADKHVSDDKLLQLLDQTVEQVIEPYSLLDIQVMTSSQQKRVASTTIKDNRTGHVETFTSAGDGPIEALVQSIRKAIPLSLQFDDLELYSVNSGEKANAEAVVSITAEGENYRGTGMDQDIILAVARGYMSAVNQAVRAVSDKRNQSLA